MIDVEKKTGISDAECEHLDNYYTKNTFEPGPNLLKMGIKPGFVHSTILLSDLDTDVAKYIYTQAKAFHKTQIEIINDLVREKLAVGA